MICCAPYLLKQHIATAQQASPLEGLALHVECGRLARVYNIKCEQQCDTLQIGFHWSKYAESETRNNGFPWSKCAESVKVVRMVFTVGVCNNDVRMAFTVGSV
jgi:hypothetical protein